MRYPRTLTRLALSYSRILAIGVNDQASNALVL